MGSTIDAGWLTTQAGMHQLTGLVGAGTGPTVISYLGADVLVGAAIVKVSSYPIGVILQQGPVADIAVAAAERL